MKITISFRLRIVIPTLTQQRFLVSRYCTKTAIKISTFNSLRILYIIFWWYSPSLPYPSKPFKHCILLFFITPVLHPYTLGCLATHRVIINLSGTVSLKTLDSPSSRGFLLPPAPQLGMTPRAPSLFHGGSSHRSPACSYDRHSS